jgi:hypothetical protein
MSLTSRRLLALLYRLITAGFAPSLPALPRLCCVRRTGAMADDSSAAALAKLTLVRRAAACNA